MIKSIATFLLTILVYTNLFSQEQLTYCNVSQGTDSDPILLGTIDSKSIFAVHDEWYDGYYLYKTDGTEAGTQLFSHISSHYSIKSPQPVIKDKYVYFVASDTSVYSYTAIDLWRTDGTTKGTSKVADKIATLSKSYESVYSIHLSNSVEYFFVTIHNSLSETIIKKYDNNFQLLSTKSGPTSSAKPTIFNNEIFLKLPSVFLDGGNAIPIVNKGDFVIDNVLYRTYSNDLASLYSSNALNPVIIGVVNKIDANTTGSYTLRLNNTANTVIHALEYFAYKNQLYTLVVSSPKDSIGGVTAEVYHLNKTSGFELKGTYSISSAINFASSDIKGTWQNDHFLNIFSGASSYQHLAIDLQTYQSAIVKTIAKSYSAREVIRGIFEIRTDSNKPDKILYNGNNRTEIPLENVAIDWQGEISPDKWFVALKQNKGNEPYLFDLSNGTFTLIKDIANKGGAGIDNLVSLNGQLVWTSTEAEGFMIYKSDGTRNGTRLLSNISPTIPQLVGNQLWEKFDTEILFTNLLQSNNESYNHFSYLHYATNGTDKVLKLFESKDFLEGSAVLKTEDYYYHLYAETRSPLILKLVRISLDGKERKTTIINLSSKNYSATADRASKLVTVIAGKYFSISTAYPTSPVIDPSTGEIINVNNELYYGSFKDKDFFYKYSKGDNLSKIPFYTYENKTLVKVFEMDYPVITHADTKQVRVFSDSENFYITDGTAGNTKKVTGLSKNFLISNVKSINNGYLFQDYHNKQWQIYKDGVIKPPSLPAPQTDARDNIEFESNVLIYKNKLYFDGQNNISELVIYAFDGNDISEAANLGGYRKGNRQIALNETEGGFWLNINKHSDNYFENTLMFWKPDTAVVKVAEGDIVMYGLLPNNKVIFKLYTETRGSAQIRYQLYSSDGKSPAQLLTEKEFTEEGISGLKPFAVVGNKLYFSVLTPATGYEPWETDGTAAGTRMVADLSKGPQSSSPDSFMEVNGIPVCIAITPDLGRQLFSLKTTLYQPLILVPSNQACEGDSIVLTASKDYDTYTWIIDDKDEIKTVGNTLTVSKSGNYKVVVTKGSLSSLPSNTVNINFIPLPAKPVIVSENNHLNITTTGQEIQWYLNGTAITGAINKSLTYSGAGNYTVKVTEKGCANISDSLFFSITSLEENYSVIDEVFPNPASERLTIRLNEDKPVLIELIDMKGSVVLREKTSGSIHKMNISHVNKGVYVLKWKENNRKIVIE